MKKYLKLMRVHHYLKNGLILLPLIFSQNLLNTKLLYKSLFGILAFSFLASVVYIINDIQDVEKDRRHPVKCKRPIASGEVAVKAAWLLVGILIFLSVFMNYIAIGANLYGWIFIGLYVSLNLAYSLGLKNIPLLDVTILVSGFLLRVLYGAIIINVAVSSWMYLTVISMSFYLGLGKRRNELEYQGQNTRGVLEHYNYKFLDKNMYMCLALTIVFYALWCVDPNTIAAHSNGNVVWTVPLVLIICMKYSLDIEGGSHGDPVDVLLHDRVLILLAGIYGLITFCIIYLPAISNNIKV